MIAIKKISLTLLVVSLTANSFSQDRGDLGVIFSSNDKTTLNLEYRKPLKGKYDFLIGASYGSTWSDFGYNNFVTGSTDTSVTYGVNHSNGSHVFVRVGAQRQLKESHFSVGGELNLGYENEYRSYYNSTLYLDTMGGYSNGPITTVFPVHDNPTASRKRSHYFEPGVRLSLNLDLPFGDRFFLHLSIATLFSAPIYLGETDFHDPHLKFQGNPPTIFNYEQMGSIGLRYRFKN